MTQAAIEFFNRRQICGAATRVLTLVLTLAGHVACGVAPVRAQSDAYAPDGPVILTPLPPPDSAPSAAPASPSTGQEPASPPPAPVSGSDLQRIIEEAPPAAHGDAQSAVPAAPSFRGTRLQPRIDWRVENPFRLFLDPADTQVHRATYLALAERERRNPVLTAERLLAQRHRDGWAASTIGGICWDGDRNTHSCKARDDYLSPRSHAIVATIEGIAETQSVECAWSTLPRGTAGTAPTTVLQSCAKPVRIEVPYPGGVDVLVSIGGVEVARVPIVVQDLLIVGMGDSFASGEGNPDVPVRFSRERAASYGGGKANTEVGGLPARVGTWKAIGDKAFIRENARWLDQACHRSLYSHQLRAALQLAIEAPHRAVTYVGLACSGAEITEGLFLRYKGNEWVPNPPELSQISAAAVAQCGGARAEPQDLPEAYHIKGAVPELGGLVLWKCPAEKARRIDLLLVSIGGNDIGFARLLANAVLADQSSLRKLGGWFGHVHGQTAAASLFDALDERYKSLNRALHNILHIPWSESDRILLTGYPGLALLGDGSAVCPDGNAGMDVVGDFRLSSDKAREGVWISDKLNRIMAASARQHGWTFVDHHRRQFVDRGICAGFTENAFSIADDLRIPRRVDGKWVPYNPADFQAYAPRQRWFRTPNDAFMTGNFHVSQSLLQKVLKLKSLLWFQLVLASTYSGAFHPTAEGHAAIADAVVEQARAVLEKYGQNGGPPPSLVATPR